MSVPAFAPTRPQWFPANRLAACAGLALALVSAAAVPRLSAQEPAQRAELERFRDSIGGTVDSTGLLALEKRMIDQTKANRNDAMQHLRLGFLSLRLGELGGQSHYEDAASEFQWAIDLQPTWPYGWYGMGFAEYGVGDSQISFVTGIKTMLGKDALTRSAMAFAKSAEVDPSFDHGLVDLANTALRQRVNIKLGVALEALRRAASTPAATHPEVMLARGRVEREVGDGDSALVAFQGYVTNGPNKSLGQLEVARTLFLLGRFDGVAPYFEGAASDDSVTVAAYRADLLPIASDSVMGEFDRTSGARRAEYLKRFWSERDHIELRADGERLREHYRRLFYARKNFQLTSLNRHYDIVERYRSGSRDFDDRGIIYLRHGEPSSRASYAAPGLEPNESWRYSRPDGDLIFHFMAREDVQDYKLVESLFDVLGFSNALALRGGLAGSEGDPMAQQLLLSREQLSPIYGRLQAAGRISTGRYQTEERQVGQESIALGTTSDSYELRFPDELKVNSEVLAVGRDSTGTQVQIAYAIAGATLEPVMVTRGYLYSVRVRFVATDRFGRVAASIDTTRHFVAPGAGARRRAPGRPGVGHRSARPLRLPSRHPAGRGDRHPPADRHRPRRPADRHLARPQRPRARQPEHQPLLAPHRGGHGRVQSAAHVQAEGEHGAVLRGRGAERRNPVHGEDRGAEAGRGRRACSRRSSAGARRRSASSSRSAPRSRSPAPAGASSSTSSSRGTTASRSRWRMPRTARTGGCRRSRWWRRTE